MGAKVKKGGLRPDVATLLGLLLGVGGILAGFYLEHGTPGQMIGKSAALIVFGGTLGATLVANPLSLITGALRRLRDVFVEPPGNPGALMESIIRYATRARKDGLVSLEQDAEAIEDPFLRKALGLAVDGADLQEIRSMLELEIDVEEQRREKEAKVFESAGGYAPTIGIIGAVLGLILVMNHLDDMKEVGKGIAAAFVATIYGVGSANLLFLPAAHKLKARAQAETERRELILEGVVGLVEGLNPKLIRSKLEAYANAVSGTGKAEAVPSGRTVAAR
jgi:chemotaxis protein MotA